MCSGAKISGSELADNCREKRQLDSRGKKSGRGGGLAAKKRIRTGNS